jgi:c-di-GMP-binding flagellar brake protein YcgR
LKNVQSNRPNRRRSIRYRVAVTIEVDITDDTWVGETRDISAEGVSLVLDREVNEGEIVGVTLIVTQDGIEDAKEEPFQSQAEVVWSAPTAAGPWMAGLRFRRLGEHQARQLERFLKAFAAPTD